MVQLSLRVLTSLTMMAAALACVHHPSPAVAHEPVAVVSVTHAAHSPVAAPVADEPLEFVLSGHALPLLLPVTGTGWEPAFTAFAETHGERAPPRR